MSGLLPSGHTYKVLEDEELKGFKGRYRFYTDGAILVNPGNFYIPKPFLKFAECYRNFEIRESDIFMLTYPKSGTNWTQEIVWNLVNNPDMNNPDAKIPLDTRSPFFELDYYFLFENSDIPYELVFEGEFFKTFRKHFPEKNPKKGLHIYLPTIYPDPRILRAHLAYTLLSPDLFDKSKVIYLARDVRDVIVSGFHFLKLHKCGSLKATLEEFVEDFITDKVPVPFGPYWEHLSLHWEKRNHPNLLFLYYEDLKKDPNAEIKKIDKFIGTNRTDEQIENIVQYTNFSNMKEITKHNPPTSFDNAFFNKEEVDKGNSFFRKGKVGSWKEDLPLHLQEKVNSWMKENLKRFSSDFKYKKEFQE